MYLLQVLINWYSICSGVVRWHSCVSCLFSFTRGVYQGGVLSPTLFAVYVDDLIRKLVESGLRCSVGNVNIGCLFYADDIVLLSWTLCKLQNMLNVCSGELSRTLEVR